MEVFFHVSSLCGCGRAGGRLPTSQRRHARSAGIVLFFTPRIARIPSKPGSRNDATAQRKTRRSGSSRCVAASLREPLSAQYRLCFINHGNTEARKRTQRTTLAQGAAVSPPPDEAQASPKDKAAKIQGGRATGIGRFYSELGRARTLCASGGGDAAPPCRTRGLKIYLEWRSALCFHEARGGGFPVGRGGLEAVHDAAEVAVQLLCFAGDVIGFG